MFHIMIKYRVTAILLIITVVFFGWFVYYSEKNENLDRFHFKFGLDLDGGTHLTYRADVSQTDPSDIENSMSSLREVIERRVNIFGVSEPIVQVEKGSIFGNEADNYRLIVELPGVTDVSQAIKQIGQTPTLEFRLQKDPSELDFDTLSNTSTPTTSEDLNLSVSDLYKPTGLTGAELKRASLSFSQLNGQPQIVVTYNNEGKELLKKITSENIDQVMAIFLDGELISAPVIRDEISNGEAVISGQFTAEEARDLVRNLNFGALPVPIELIETQTIGATLGEETLYHGVNALSIGLAIIFMFLLIYYRLPGLVATFALISYASIMLLIFKAIPVTLTASGLAGFILSIGMAVDANVLIFERMKEERRDEASLREAILNGSKRAWTSIRDGNFTSIISAVVLYWMSGSSLVKGFALVFGLGVLVSMFTAIVMTKYILISVTPSPEKENKFVSWLFGSGFNFKKDIKDKN